MHDDTEVTQKEVIPTEHENSHHESSVSEGSSETSNEYFFYNFKEA